MSPSPGRGPELTPSLGSSTRPDLVAEAIAHAELRSNQERFRFMARVGLALWLAMIPVDAVLAWVVVPGPLWVYVAIRVGMSPVFLATIRAMAPHRELPPQAFRRHEATLLLGISYGVSVMTVFGGGLLSPYLTGLAATTVGRGAAMAQRWREALPVNLAILVGHPVILAVGALHRPDLAAQWRDPVALGTFGVGMALLTAVTLLALIGGHTHWALRRQALTSQNVGRYQLAGSLGRGGMGEVWRARVRGTHQEVALKVLHSADPASLGRFDREIRSLATLHHPNTVRVLDFGMTDTGIPFFAMELLFGRDLERLIREGGPLPLPRALTLVGQVASALGEAHGHGIVHRDVKPANILLLDGTHGVDHVKLVDFGIARSAHGDDRVTRHGSVVGTPAYLSPELFLGREADPRADVYALGATLVFLVSGAPPFRGEVAELLAAHRERPTPTFASLGIEASPEAEAVLARCLAKDPADRYPDGSALAWAISGRGPPLPSDFEAPASPRASDTLSLESLLPSAKRR